VIIPNNINVADPSFNHPHTFDKPIGGDTYWDIMYVDKFKIKGGPYLQSILFGWVVVGKTLTNLDVKISYTYLLTTQNQYKLLDIKSELFWQMEELSSKHNYEENVCITHFNKNVIQYEDGKVVVKLPLEENYC